MATKLNSEFNYRTQVIGETVWEKIKTLKGFLEGRERAAKLEEVSELKYAAKKSELEHARRIDALPHVLLTLTAELREIESFHPSEKEAFELNRQEIAMLKRLLSEHYAIAEPSRIPGYTDEQMFEANAEDEFTATILKDMLAETIANGRPSAAKIRNAMSCQKTFAAAKELGLLPHDAPMLLIGQQPATQALDSKETG